MSSSGKPPRSTSDPAVVIDIAWRDSVLYLVGRNIAAQAVHDVRVAFRRKIYGMGGRVDISKLPFWSSLAVMPPGRAIEVTVDRDVVFFAHNKTGPIALSVTYTMGDGTTLRGQQKIDFEAYRDFPELCIR